METHHQKQGCRYHCFGHAAFGHTKSKDLLGTFIADLVLQLLSFVAENERAAILQRQREGIASAKARGVRFGRPQRSLSKEYAENYMLWKNKKLPAKQAADNSGMPLWAFYKYGDRIKWFSLKSIGFRIDTKPKFYIRNCSTSLYFCQQFYALFW